MLKYLPQILLTALLVLRLGINMGLHGRPTGEDKHNSIYAFINVTVTFALLCWGGFFMAK